MAFTQYEGAGQVFVRGRLLAEAKRVRMSINANDNRVTTMLKGLSGWSDGPPSVDGSIDTAIPKAGYEVDFWELCEKKTEFTLVVVDGGKRRVASVRFTTVETEKSDGSAATASGTFEGKPVGNL